MKITHISIQNVAGVSSAQVATTAPITIVAGRNGAGKSSVSNAVRMALTGDTSARGITLKKELGGLVHDGAKSGEVLLTCAAGLPELYALVPSGKTTPSSVYAPHHAMPFVTSPELFAQLQPNERRAFQFQLMGLSASGPAVVERLLAKGCDRAKIDRVLPMLRSGFEAASKEAKNLATQGKGAWRTVTGDVYGSVKACGWMAQAPSAAAAEGEPTGTAKLKACEAALESWQQQVGKLRAEQQRRGELSSRLANLDEQAGRIARIERKLATDKQELAAQTARLDTLAASATGVRVGLVHDLAHSLDSVLRAMEGSDEEGLFGHAEPVVEARGVLATYEREHGPVGVGAGDPAAASALPALRQSVEMLARAIGNDNRDLVAAERAKADAEAIRAELTQPAGTGLAEARAQVEKLKAERAAITKAIDAAAAVKRAAAEAKEKTAKAAQHHADVIAWDAIGDALAPDGIPGEMLSEALDPINERLARSALDAEWPRVGIESDMSISVGDSARPYALLSESEKWRADAMLAEAISHLSGLKLLVLDRFDVLDLPGRGDLIAWLDILAADGEIDTALLCGTLKALPTGLPDTVAAHWIENGRLNGSASRELAAAPVTPAACDAVQVEAAGKQPGLPAEFAAYIDGQESAGQVEDGAAAETPAVCQRVMQNGQVCGLTPGCPDCGSSLVDYPEPVALEVAAAPQGEPMPSAPSTAAPTVSPAPAAVELPDADEPTQAERMAGAYAAGVEVARQGHTRWSTAFLDADAAALSGLRDAAADAVHAEMLRGFEDGKPIPRKPELKQQAEAATARAGGKIAAKYRDPATGQTWIGRGLRPRWLVQALEDGKTQDEFLIDPA